MCAAFASSSVTTPSLSLSAGWTMPSKVGPVLVLCPAPNLRRTTFHCLSTGVVQVNDGIPASDQFSTPVFKS